MIAFHSAATMIHLSLQNRNVPASLRWLQDRNGESSEAVNLPCLVTLAPERPRNKRVSTSSFGPDITASMFALFSSFFLVKNCTTAWIRNWLQQTPILGPHWSNFSSHKITLPHTSNDSKCNDAILLLQVGTKEHRLPNTGTVLHAIVLGIC